MKVDAGRAALHEREGMHINYTEMHRMPAEARPSPAGKRQQGLRGEMEVAMRVAPSSIDVGARRSALKGLLEIAKRAGSELPESKTQHTPEVNPF